MDYLNQRVNNLKIIVFDLDYTLWPFWIDGYVSPAFRSDPNGNVSDAYGHEVTCYPEVAEVLKSLKSLGYTLGIASRATATVEALKLLELFKYNQYFTYKQIYPGVKTTHFNSIRTESKVEFSEMLFFDDETRNIRDLKAKGVVSILVDNGINKKVVAEGIETFVKKSEK